MNNQQKQMLVPQYMNKFSCIGSECEDTCCNGWTISIDKATYKKYKKLSNQKIKTEIENSMQRNKKSSSDKNYAKFILNSNGCSMQSEEGLCCVHRDLGASYLSNTCFSYPRMFNKVDNITEMGGTMSCPEIARLALFNPKGIEFDMKVQEENTRGYTKYSIDSTNDKNKLFWEIRAFAIFILQDRRYSVDNRLINLGMWINKLTDKNKQYNMNELLHNIGEYKKSLTNSQLEESLNNIKPNYSLNAKICYEILEVRKQLVIQSDRFKQLLCDIADGLNLEKENFDHKFNDLITDIKREFYSPYFDNHEYVLENYLVNDLFINCFGYDFEKLHEQYNLLVLKYSLIKLHLFGVASKYEGLTDELVVYVIQTFSKGIEHNHLYLKIILDLVVTNNFNSLAHMAILIKS
ncbi:flagellin lysine-N-methylase [Gottfriedia luciferensis]|uniref:flagellin lysine-N-methylase n=1 Tax=Gottfriedia luciferensis TaxID=178774 RepID=UPI000B4415D6|nr:flagellin lysine-N-methylase [Gottfriedia luciferensis]